MRSCLRTSRPVSGPILLWRFLSIQALFDRRIARHWVVSAKQEPTRERRFAVLLVDSAAGRRLARFTGPGTMPGRVLISGGDGFAEDWAGGGRGLVEPGDMELALV